LIKKLDILANLDYHSKNFLSIVEQKYNIMYAVIKLGKSQYVVEEGKQYTVPKFSAEPGKFEVSEVLALMEGKNSKLGTPFVDGAKVALNIVEHKKGEKVTTKVYKAKSRYAKKKGFRKQDTVFTVESIKSK
jgi:large subunit ribosomal protein L21